MNKFIIFLSAILFSIGVHAQSLVNVNEKGVILDGYDVVAFQQSNQAIAGSYNYESTYQSAIYRFSSEKNKSIFDKNSSKYAPQFGGFCAVSTSMGHLEPGNVETWSVVGGKLYVQRNAKAKGMWDQKGSGAFIPKAVTNWPELVTKYGSELTWQDVSQGQLTLEAARRIGDKAIDYLKANKAPGGAIAIVDDAGFPIYLLRATGTFSAASDVSTQKARSAALFGFDTKKLEDGILAGRNSLITANYNMMRGGVPIYFKGEVVGAIGVSGAASADQDMEIARAGLGQN